MYEPFDKLVLQYILECINDSKFPPSCREIGEALDCSHEQARRAILRLESEKLLYRVPSIARGIVVTAKGIKAVKEKESDK